MAVAGGGEGIYLTVGAVHVTLHVPASLCNRVPSYLR